MFRVQVKHSQGAPGGARKQELAGPEWGWGEGATGLWRDRCDNGGDSGTRGTKGQWVEHRLTRGPPGLHPWHPMGSPGHDQK